MTNFSHMIEIGEAAVHGAVELLSDILEAAERTSDAQMGANAAALLKKPRTIGSEHDPLGEAARLAGSSQARLAALSAFGRRLDLLTETLRGDVSQLKQLLVAIPGDDPNGVAGRSVAVQRLHHLTASEASLARCQILLRQLARTEHLCGDTLGLMRDVTVPMATREAALAGLTRATEAAKSLGRESDSFCRELLEQGARNLVHTREK